MFIITIIIITELSHWADCETIALRTLSKETGDIGLQNNSTFTTLAYATDRPTEMVNKLAHNNNFRVDADCFGAGLNCVSCAIVVAHFR